MKIYSIQWIEVGLEQDPRYTHRLSVTFRRWEGGCRHQEVENGSRDVIYTPLELGTKSPAFLNKALSC
jgi:hypothetical protein